MAQRRHHYDNAFEVYLRERAIPYIAVDEARRTLATRHPPTSLKNFDFVVYSQKGPNLLVDVKGRKHSGTTGKSLQTWVTADDVDCLRRWEKLFGEGFRGAFAFLFWCDVQPPDALFADIFAAGEKWYAVLTVGLTDYQEHMRPRSERWGTVSIPAKAFNAVARPLKDLV